MQAEDTFKTISNAAEGIFRDKGSKFLAYAYPIASEAQVKPILHVLSIQHPKARHHCWAYRLGLDTGNYRLNDDGEPAGTAGRPILNTLLSAELTNVFVVVVRYFGGTLLGVPGLINAYKSATLEAINNSTIIEKTVNETFRIDCDYLQLNSVMRIIKELNLEIQSQVFDLQCVFIVQVRKTHAEALRARFGLIDLIKVESI